MKTIILCEVESSRNSIVSGPHLFIYSHSNKEPVPVRASLCLFKCVFLSLLLPLCLVVKFEFFMGSCKESCANGPSVRFYVLLLTTHRPQTLMFHSRNNTRETRKGIHLFTHKNERTKQRSQSICMPPNACMTIERTLDIRILSSDLQVIPTPLPPTPSNAEVFSL